MKLRITRKAAVAAAAVIAFTLVLSTCDTNWFTEEIKLELTSVRINNMEISGIPAPIEAEDWDDEEYTVAASDFGLVVVKRESDMVNTLITARATRNAVVTYGLAKGGTRPQKFDDLRRPATFEWSDFIFFKVSDPLKGESVYYRFYPNEASPVKELAGFAIAGRDPQEIDNTPIPTKIDSMETLASQIQEAPTRFMRTIYITRAEALSALVAATPQDERARIRFAVAPSLNAALAGNFGEWEAAEKVVIQDEQNKDITQGHDTMTFTDNSVLAVEVMAQNDTANYYAFQVYTERMASVKTLTFDGNVVAGIGTPATRANWSNAGLLVPGDYTSADQKPAGFDIAIELEDPDGTAEWGVINTTAAAEPAWTPGLTLTQKFNHKQALALKINSPRGNAADTRYYKVEVNLLAGNFKRHPKSAAYTITSYTYQPANAPGEEYHGRILIDADGTVTLDREIEELSFELDREGTFTYQWYTANSWYGGYGFDKDGRIGGDPGSIRDDYHPSATGTDEKQNISFHNGGNTWYRLPYPAFDSLVATVVNEENTSIAINNPNGNRIIGANSATYKPTITAKNRPFISPGFTNQTQYYWVIVTDENGLKVESKRAVIVTEWGIEFRKGEPLSGTTVAKKHHIVDLHAWMDPSPTAYGLKDNPRNAVAFKAGNHGDSYFIPITFPPDFNIKDYSIVTCWANFYLADGRPWIQNWTNGDFGFADADKNKIVLWYNVTNDNATRGLGSSGNEPAGGGLNEKPAYLVVQPAGTTPIKRMPPFNGKDPYGRDKPDKAEVERLGYTAQGWFTPYIEITELRFEGPAR